MPVEKPFKVRQAPVKKSIRNNKNELSNSSRLEILYRYVWPTIIVVATAIVYLPLFRNGLTGRDDDFYILNNPYISTFNLKMLVDVFSTFYMGNYHPLTMLVYALGYQIGGTDAWPYQLINLVLHVLNTMLVYQIVRKLTIKVGNEQKLFFIPVLVASCFALHPVQVESVAWISETKTVLYSLFFFLSILRYIRFVENGNRKYYVQCLVLFLLSLLSKGMAVTLALTLPVIDFALKRNLGSKHIWIEKIPFFVLAFSFGILAIIAQGSAVATTTGGGEFNILRAIVFAGYGFVHYLINVLIPVHLSPVYEYLFDTAKALPAHFFIYPVMALLILTGLFYFFRHNRAYLFGFIFFLSNIIFLLQLLPVGDAIMADRYLYIPSVGLFFMIFYGLSDLRRRFPSQKKMALILVFVYLAFLATLTFNRIPVWKNNLTLWEDVLKKSDYNPYSRAWIILAKLYNENKQSGRAVSIMNQFLSARPDNAEGYFERAYIKSTANDLKGAELDYIAALRLDSSNVYLYNNLGYVYFRMGNNTKALLCLNQAIALSDTFVDAFNGRADVLMQLGRNPEALSDLNASLERRPDNPYALNNRGVVKTRLMDHSGAIIDFSLAIAKKSNYVGALQNRISSELFLQDYGAALKDLNIVIGLQPSGIAYYLRAFAKVNLHLDEEACEDYRIAVKMGYQPKDSSRFLFCIE